MNKKCIILIIIVLFLCNFCTIKSERIFNNDSKENSVNNSNKDSKEKDKIKENEVDETTIIKNSDVKIKFITNNNKTYQKKQSIKIEIIGEIDGELRYQWSNDKPNTFSNVIENNQTVSISNHTGTFYLWISFNDKNGKNHIVKSPPVLIDNTAPSISYEEDSNLYYSLTENEGTIVNINDSHSGIKTAQYVWSRSNKQTPNNFPNNFSNGQKISKAANSKAFYLWIKVCDQVDNCSISVSKPFVGTLIHPNTVNNDRPRLTTCGTFDGNEIAIYNYILESRISNAQTKREKVVAAARFLAIEFPYRIVYYMNDIIAKYPTQGHYYQKGLYLNSSNGWGCSIKKEKDFSSLNFITGNFYPNGLDCSGFITWAFYNGGN